jgi:hypothetical protein
MQSQKRQCDEATNVGGARRQCHVSPIENASTEIKNKLRTFATTAEPSDLSEMLVRLRDLNEKLRAVGAHTSGV